MRVEIHDGMGYSHRIDSRDYAVIGQWFAGVAKMLMSADTRYNHPVQMDIWPSGPNIGADLEALRESHVCVRDIDGLFSLTRNLLMASDLWQAQEVSAHPQPA